MNHLQYLLQNRSRGQAVMSACTAHPLAIEAVLEHAQAHGLLALVEATANQVNQYGGYTGMKPADFVSYVRRISEGRDCRIMLGGDHLGPLVWRSLPGSEAMPKAAELISLYAAAGFGKIHIDTSMRLGGDPPALQNEVIAERAAFLCRHAEDAADPANPPVYVIGSEVPVPGGAQHAEAGIAVTRPEDFLATVEAFRSAFAKQGLESAWERVIAVVVQPGVEFGDEQIFEYDRERAKALTDALKPLAPLVFEGHSTDYQPSSKLRQMAEDGIAILKVGPALTFAVREALFALCEMEKWLISDERSRSRFMQHLEEAMLANPAGWAGHYHGTPGEQAFKRRFSLSDRARYYLADSKVDAAAQALIKNIDAHKPPMSLISQYMPAQYTLLSEGKISPGAGSPAESLIKSRVTERIETYFTFLPE